MLNPSAISALFISPRQEILSHGTTYIRLLLALFLGVCVGAERQWRQRSAGLRTNTLVCLGAATFVDLGLAISPGTSQVIAYVVSGVGFLGAGAIMKDGANVRGLNTAATLWCSAAVGACAGAGQLFNAVFVTALLVAINSALRPLSRIIDRRSLSALKTPTLYRLRLVAAADHEQAAEFLLTKSIAERSLILREFRTEDVEGTTSTLVQALIETTIRSDHALEELATNLRVMPWVESVDLTTGDTEAE